jgi:hypothetical protein
VDSLCGTTVIWFRVSAWPHHWIPIDGMSSPARDRLLPNLLANLLARTGA